MNRPVSDQPSDTTVACHFVRGCNALLCAADFGPLFMDMYLHLGRLGVVLDGGGDGRLKQFLAALVLHASSRPRDETIAWTAHFESEGVNLFAVVENPTGRVAGRVFDRGVRALPGNVLHAETATAAGGRRRSSVDFQGDGAFEAAAAYFRQSEQRPARLLEWGGDEFALLAAQPDCDMEWFSAVSIAEIRAMLAAGERPPLEIRVYRFDCGCSPQRLADAIGPAVRRDPEGAFGGEDFLRVECPRCGIMHEVRRGDLGLG